MLRRTWERGRIGFSLVALGLSLAGCPQRQPSVTCPNETPATQTIMVNDDGTVSKPCAAINKTLNQTITWRPANPGTTVTIQLVVHSGQTVPFGGITCSPLSGGDQGCWLKINPSGEVWTDGYADGYKPTASVYYDYYPYATPAGRNRVKGPLVGIRIDP